MDKKYPKCWNCNRLTMPWAHTTSQYVKDDYQGKWPDHSATLAVGCRGALLGCTYTGDKREAQRAAGFIHSGVNLHKKVLNNSKAMVKKGKK